MVVHHGDIFWIELRAPVGSAPGYRHPHVVIQNDAFNDSRIRTVIVCLLTSNLKRANDIGNVLLDVGEAGLAKQSVVNVSQVITVDRSQLKEKIGAVSAQRVEQIIAGIRMVLEPRAG